MHLTTALRSVGVFAVLACATAVQAQLPDLRGQSFYVTGNIFVAGVAFGTQFAALAPTGINVDRDNASRLRIAASGPENNSALTGSFKIPDFDTACVNPTIPLTGSFNRSTGAFSLSGTIAGESVLNFSTANVPGVGNSRILVKFRNLGITLTGTGSVEGDGFFRIRQPGSNAFTYDRGADTPQLALQDPALCDFGGLIDVVTGSAFAVRNWIAAQAAIRGTISLEEIPDLSAVVTPIHPIDFTFVPTNGDPTFVRQATLNADGSYAVLNVSPGVYRVGIKGDKWLQKVALNVDIENSDATGINANLPGGDSNGDNFADALDLADLITAFNTATGDTDFNPAADFNADGSDDALDLAILITNFNTEGETP